MKIIHLTDPHVAEPGALYGLDPLARLDECLNHISREHADAALCVITGDLVDAGTVASYRQLKDSLSRLQVPYRLLMGNHDDRRNFRSVFPAHPHDGHDFVQSVFDTPAGRLLFLDTLDDGKDEGRLCERRLKWIAAQLAGAADRSVFVFMHHPPQSIGVKRFDSMGLTDPLQFMDLLRASGKVRHIFFGHVHLSVHGAMDGIPFTTNRGTSHHIVLDLELEGRQTFVADKPSYGVALLGPNGAVVHSVDFLHENTVIRPSDARLRPSE